MRHFTLAVAVALALSAGMSCADVFNMGGGDTSLSFVTVGDPGNVAGSNPYGGTNDFGSVGYTYQMGTYDVTCAVHGVSQRRGHDERPLRLVQQLHEHGPTDGRHPAIRQSGQL